MLISSLVTIYLKFCKIPYCVKTNETTNAINRKFNGFLSNIKYISLVWQILLIFSLVLRTRENIKQSAILVKYILY